MTARASKTKWWTPSQERELARLRSEGVPVREIAARLGRTPCAIYAQIHRYPEDYPRRSWREKWYDALQVMHVIADVAAKAGVQPRTVRDQKTRLRRMGYEVGPAKANNRRLTPDDVREIRSRRAKGEKVLVLAEEYRVSQSAVTRIVQAKTRKGVAP